MECVFCHCDPDVVATVPHPETLYAVFSCVPCATEHGLYCEKHDTPHAGYSGGGGSGTICLTCFHDERTRCAPDAEDMFYELAQQLPGAEWGRVREWLNDMSDVYQEDSPVMLLRGIVGEALRRRVPPQEVVRDAIAVQSASAILPLAY